MIALYIILGILLLIIIIGLLRLGLYFEYSQDGARLVLKIAFVKIQVFPEIKKKEKKKAKRPAPSRKEKAEKPKRTVGETVKRVKAVIPTVVQALNRLRRRLKVNQLTVIYTIASDDPADTAIKYGRVAAATSWLFPTLNSVLNIKKSFVKTQTDFVDTEDRIYICADVSIAVWELIYILLKLDFKAIMNLF